MCWVFSRYDHKSATPAVTHTGLWFLWSRLKDTSILMKLMPLQQGRGTEDLCLYSLPDSNKILEMLLCVNIYQGKSADLICTAIFFE